MIESKKGKGYEIGEKISVHEHIHYPDNYLLTIRSLNIHGQVLCSRDASKAEILSAVYKVIYAKEVEVDDLKYDVLRSEDKLS